MRSASAQYRLADIFKECDIPQPAARIPAPEYPPASLSPQELDGEEHRPAAGREKIPAQSVQLRKTALCLLLALASKRSLISLCINHLQLGADRNLASSLVPEAGNLPDVSSD